MTTTHATVAAAAAVAVVAVVVSTLVCLFTYVETDTRCGV